MTNANPILAEPFSFQTSAIIGVSIVTFFLTYLIAQLIYYVGCRNNKIKFNWEIDISSKSKESTDSHQDVKSGKVINRSINFASISYKNDIPKSNSFIFDYGCEHLYVFGCNHDKNDKKLNTRKNRNDVRLNGSVGVKVCMEDLSKVKFKDFSPLKANPVNLHKFVLFFGGFVPIVDKINTSNRLKCRPAFRTASKSNKNRSNRNASYSKVSYRNINRTEGHNKMKLSDKLVVFDTEIGEWFTIDNKYFDSSGVSRPSARYGSKIVRISEHEVMLVGGRGYSHSRNGHGDISNDNDRHYMKTFKRETCELNDVWVLHLDSIPQSNGASDDRQHFQFRWECIQRNNSNSYINSKAMRLGDRQTCCFDNESNLYILRPQSLTAAELMSQDHSAVVLESYRRSHLSTTCKSFHELPRVEYLLEGDKLDLFSLDHKGFLFYLSNESFLFISNQLDEDTNFNSIFLLHHNANSNKADQSGRSKSISNCRIKLKLCGDKTEPVRFLANFTASLDRETGMLYIFGVNLPLKSIYSEVDRTIEPMALYVADVTTYLGVKLDDSDIKE